jgi:ABC-type xylose transport system substrate-binding protein
MRQILDPPDVDAVFAANDLMALGALEVLKGAGLRMPYLIRRSSGGTATGGPRCFFGGR